MCFQSKLYPVLLSNEHGLLDISLCSGYVLSTTLKSGFKGLSKNQSVTTGTNSAMNQSEFPTITGNLLKAREKFLRTRCDWFCFSLVEKLARDFKPMTKLGNRVVTFDGHLKSALPECLQIVGTFRSEYEYDYEYEFSVLSTRIRFRGRHFSKCACSERKTRTRSRTRTPI